MAPLRISQDHFEALKEERERERGGGEEGRERMRGKKRSGEDCSRYPTNAHFQTMNILARLWKPPLELVFFLHRSRHKERHRRASCKGYLLRARARVRSKYVCMHMYFLYARLTSQSLDHSRIALVVTGSSNGTLHVRARTPLSLSFFIERLARLCDVIKVRFTLNEEGRKSSYLRIKKSMSCPSVPMIINGLFKRLNLSNWKKTKDYMSFETFETYTNGRFETFAIVIDSNGLTS